MSSTQSEQKSDVNILQFEKLLSNTDSTFWQELGRKKINELKLSEEAIPIFGLFTGGISHSNIALPPKIFYTNNSFNLSTPNIPKFHFKIPGQLLNTNKIESFKKLDKKQLLHENSTKIVNDIKSKQCIKNPSLLYRFFIISFADLKKHKYVYWCCYPAIVPKNFKINRNSITKFTSFDTKQSQASIIKNFYKFCGDNEIEQSLLFVINKDYSFQTISQFDANKDKQSSLLMFGYIDNGNLPNAPSWFSRNILLFLSFTFPTITTKPFKIIAIRNLADNLKDSLIFDLQSKVEGDSQSLLDGDNIRCVGWERNSDNKLLPKKADLSKMLDPVQLSTESVDLNLKLMRWRRLPQIDLQLIKNQKCLLCGAGTLGTYISRVLLAWGCSNITFIDNGKVSYSNPVRQCLFKYTDCIDDGSGNNSKAKTAANSVKEIFPEANVNGYNLSIPMPGHFVDKSVEQKSKSEFELFDKLVQENDVIFLLTDSRESRWLPTLLAKVYNKIVINIALGFDSYLIMRHSHNKDGLGCYFCSDVIAPIDSISDRSLDQQCTVTRPGLAPIAAGLGIELLVSYLQKDNTDKLSQEIPHQIRGYLYDYKNICVKPTPCYKQCAACSQNIIDAFNKDGWEFILKVLNEPKHLEKVSGLEKLKDINLDDIDIDWDDDEDEEEDKEDEWDGTDRCVILVGMWLICFVFSLSVTVLFVCFVCFRTSWSWQRNTSTTIDRAIRNTSLIDR